jgi:hypothetical protein
MMNTKEQIDTLISSGASLPPVNPYLDDAAAADDPVTKKGPGRTPAAAVKPAATKTIAPDPKEYIAELERPEDEQL